MSYLIIINVTTQFCNDIVFFSIIKHDLVSPTGKRVTSSPQTLTSPSYCASLSVFYLHAGIVMVPSFLRVTEEMSLQKTRLCFCPFQTAPVSPTGFICFHFLFTSITWPWRCDRNKLTNQSFFSVYYIFYKWTNTSNVKVFLFDWAAAVSGPTNFRPVSWRQNSTQFFSGCLPLGQNT